jgi:DNA-binding beta-propeller fold protein YncE
MKSLNRQAKIGLGLLLACASVLVALSGNPWGRRRVETRLDDQSRITVSEMDGMTCPASEPAAGETVSVPVNPITVALVMQQAAERSADAGPSEAKKAEVAARKPIFRIHDQYPQFSAVAVDEQHNEVIMADENLFQMLVYDRTTNTPPKASMSEPKRTIQGPKTFLELQCAVYIDPKNGDIYSLNNDTERHMTVWSRDQKGDEPPKWKLHTPMGSFGLAVDESTDEMLITGQTENVVAAFPRTAREEDPPAWVLWGDKTLLADPHGIAIDTKKNIIFVANFGSTESPRPLKPGDDYLRVATGRGNFIPGSGRFLPVSITVYDKKARDNTPPIRVISGPRTQLNWPTGLFVDSGRGELYVANDGGNSILVFSTDASGDAAPIRVLKGPKTQLSYPSSVYIDLKNDELWVANFGNHRATVYPRKAEGDTAPLRVIRSGPEDSPAPALANVRIGYDTKREQILAPNCVAHPQIAIFARTANGNAQAVRRIEGQRTMIGRTQHSIFYDEIHDELVVPQPFAGAVLTFHGDANGEVPPIRIIQGPKTGLVLNDVMTVDPVHNEYFVPRGQGGGMVHVFDRMAQGDVAPIRILGGPNVGLGGIPSVDYEHNLLLVQGRGGLYIYDRTAKGDDKPLRIITGGPKSGVTSVAGPVWIPGTRNFVGTARTYGLPPKAPGQPLNYQSPEEAQTFIGVWSVDDDGDVAPRYTIGHNIFKELRNLAIDPKHKTVLAADKTNNDITTFDFHEAWDPIVPEKAERVIPRGRGGRGGAPEGDGL